MYKCPSPNTHALICSFFQPTVRNESHTMLPTVCPPEQNRIPCVSITKPKSHHVTEGHRLCVHQSKIKYRVCPSPCVSFTGYVLHKISSRHMREFRPLFLLDTLWYYYNDTVLSLLKFRLQGV